MTNNPTIDGVSRDLIKRILDWLNTDEPDDDGWVAELRALLDADHIVDCGKMVEPVVELEPEHYKPTVPKFKFDTLVEHCKRLERDLGEARAHVNEITLYQQNAVWFWQHDGEDYLQSLSCPIIIQPHHLRELLEGKENPEVADLQSTIAQLQDQLAAQKENLESAVNNSIMFAEKADELQARVAGVVNKLSYEMEHRGARFRGRWENTLQELNSATGNTGESKNHE